MAPDNFDPMQTFSFDEVLDRILKSDSRYHREAYHFVREGLDHTQKIVGRSGKDEVRHVSGPELLEGIKEYGLKQYGPMAGALLEEWGVRSCRDFGEIVFLMVQSNLLAKTEKDSLDDFQEVYSFDAAFRQPFLPKSRLPAQDGRNDKASRA